MPAFQPLPDEEQPVRSLYRSLIESGQRGPDDLDAFLDPEFELHAGHPFNTLAGPEAFVERYWAPLVRALPDLERRVQLRFSQQAGDDHWTTEIGHYLGVFREPWLGIEPTDQPLFVRFGEFYRIRDGRVRSGYVLLDVLDMMRQAGCFPLRQSLGAAILVPGPATGDGVFRPAADPDESARTLKLVSDMLDGLMRYDPETGDFGVMRHADFWHPDFMWYGPAGIGTTRGIDGFIAGHQRPFLTAFPDRKGGNHVARIAEGNYAATFGWPSMHATHAGGGWMGLAPTRRRVTMRVMDWWRRDGDRLAENWVLIDFPDLLRQMDMDLFAHTPGT